MYNIKYAIGLIFFVIGLSAFAESTPPGYAVASANPLATEAGLEMLAKGGNAFDAAVAVASMLAVVEPYHTGLGGGGFFLLHDEKNHQNRFVDARETAPKAATAGMFLGPNGQPVPGLSLNGGLAAAIPGEPAALVFLAKKYGKLPLEQSLAPAIRVAKEGFVVDAHFLHFVTMGDRSKQLQKYPASAAIFLKNGQPHHPGDRLVQKDLAKTLTLIAQQSEKGFYRGEVAQRLVKAVNAAGGVWRLEDLADYRLQIREPLVGAYHNMLIITAAPPSVGGVALLTMLNILSLYELQGLPKAQWMHLVIEAMRLAYWQAWEFLGDPDFVQAPVDTLISAENAKQLKTLIQKDKVIDSKVLKGDEAKPHSTNTTHFSIIDSEGNRVAATLTVNYIFGSSVVAEGTGVLLNDEMDDFSTKPGSPNIFGTVGSDKNAIAPGKRPVSFMTPTFLETPDRLAIVGTPGGSRIPTMVLLASLVFNEGYGAISMVSGMRFHHQFLPDVVQFEPDSIPAKTQEALKAMGYKLDPLGQYYGDMQAITWDKQSNLLTAASDPRHIGLATVVNEVNRAGYGIAH